MNSEVAKVVEELYKVIYYKEKCYLHVNLLVSKCTNHLLPCELIIISHKGYPSCSKNHNATISTRWNPALFDIVERACTFSSCKGLGHNNITCKQRVESSTSNFEKLSEVI